MINVKWLLFDFGGCLDSDGLHSRAIFFHFFKQCSVVKNDEWELFQEAYTFADKLAIKKSLLVEASLLEMNKILCDLIEQHLNRVDVDGQEIAKKITDFQGSYLERNRGILTQLNKKFKLGIISNFTGNLEIILKEYNLWDLFGFVLDSYHVGVSKPDAKIFKKAIDLTGVSPAEICYMGDNAIADIIPACKQGINTVHIFNGDEPRIKTKACKPTAMISSLTELPLLVGK
jgi:HAD superfamily hydrolase (TIGR01549 family)